MCAVILLMVRFYNRLTLYDEISGWLKEIIISQKTLINTFISEITKKINSGQNNNDKFHE